MATYEEFCAVLESVRATRAGADVWKLEVPGVGGPDGGRTQKVFLMREDFGGPGDLEVIKVSSPVAPLASANLDAVLRAFGQLNAGSFGYAPYSGGDGWLTLATTIPLRPISFTDSNHFMIFVYLFGQTADNLEMQLTGGDQY